MVKNVLVVDDSQTTLFDINKKIQNTGLQVNVLLSSNYEDARKNLNSEPIDVAIIDLQMPQKNGADLIVYMKSSIDLKDIPIVVFTSAGMNSLLKTSLEPMVNHYIPKPVSKEHLLELLREHLG